jgi:transposase
MSNITFQAKPETISKRLDGFLFVGMDIHKDNHTACLTNCFGHELMAIEIENSKEDFGELVKEVGRLSKKEGLKPIFGLEDSYGNGLRLANYLGNLGFEIKNVPPALVDRKRRYNTHPEKSDSLDALGVAKVLIEKIDSLPVYSIASEDKLSKELRELINDRDTIVKERTRLKNQLHVLLHRAYGSDYKKLFVNIFSLKALKYWKKHPLPGIRKRDGIVDYSTTLRNQIKRKACRLLAIHDDLREIDKDLEELIKKSDQKLETLDGCGTVLAGKVLAEVRNIDRFSSPSKLAKYAGLSPRKKSSGKKDRDIKDRSGNRRLNNAIHRIALSQIGRYGNEHAKTYFKSKVEKGKTKVQALCCLKRQLVDIIYMMLKNRTEYHYVGKAKKMTELT